MRKLFSVILIMIGVSALMAAPSIPNDIVLNDNSSASGLSIGAILAAVVSVYETIVRIVPTVGNWTIISKVAGWIKKASDFLNVKK